MAKLDNIYISNTTDSASYSVNVTEYPVEKGMPLSDTVIQVADTFTITGYIIDKNPENILNKFKSKMEKGTVVKYVGRVIASDVLITAINPSYAGNIQNGMSVSISLKKIRIPKSPWVVRKTTTTNSGTKAKSSTSTKKYHKVKKGDTYWGVSRKYKKNLKTIMGYKENPWPARFIPIGVKIRYQ
ncbi:LysM peptidoglycan-binding domain-containing protein [Desemzia sp. C1]|uniref:phage baseplate protein n=1 Tax=Desemzia sp. C1 TaxID=2892016 RepID=UPI001E367F71|nr:LysM peptidoglycan-binding domain-containing protein [Desemzia sp. C1]MCI3027684.1 LysM peptidoglycan-binding domain-containing protein [Desemzia sp. C1]